MALDGIVLNLLSNELNEKLIGAKVTGIHQPSKEELLISFRTKDNNNYRLLISSSASSARINFTDAVIDNPKAPPMFCMLLRKHIGSAKFLGIEKFGLERYIHLCFQTYNELGDLVTLKLAVEIMGRHSNIILIGSNGKIIDSIKRVTADMSSVRQVMPGMTYTFPPEQSKSNILDLDEMDFAEKLVNGKDIPLSKALMDNINGISPIVAREISFYVVGDSDCVVSELTDENFERLFKVLDVISKNVSENKCAPYIVYDENDHPIDFTIMYVRQYGDAYKIKKCGSFSKMLDEFYSEKTSADRMKQRSSDLFRFVVNLNDRLSRKLDIQRSELEKSEKRDDLRIKGDLINANISIIQKGMTSVLLENFYDNNNLLEVKLDPRITPSQNAQHYFSEYRKADTAERMLKNLIAKGEEELSYIESVSDLLSRARSEDEVLAIKEELINQGYIKIRFKKLMKPVKITPKTYVSTDGFKIICGRNNIQNDKITFKEAKKNDIWFHTQKIHGSHTIIITEGKDVPPTTMEQAALIAAYNSKGRDSTLVPVDYTEIKNVRKPSGAAPGKVIYEHYKTAFVRPSQYLNFFDL